MHASKKGIFRITEFDSPGNGLIPVDNMLLPENMASMKNVDPLELFAVGGAGEFGRNCVLMRHLFKAVLVDCGIGMVNDEYPGITKMLPDLDFIHRHRHELVAILATHGHEDHIGAIPRVLGRVDVPVYASEYTARLIMTRARNEFGMDLSDRVHVVEPWKWYEPDPNVRFKFLPIPHSIPQAGAILVEIYGIRVLHTGDYKLAFDGLTRFDEERWHAEVSEKPVFAMIGDSTGTLEHGSTHSETELEEELQKLMSDVEGRIIVTLFSSNIQRLRTLTRISARLGRKVVLVGRSMEMYFSIAEKMGLVSSKDVIPRDRMGSLRPEELTILVSGSQAEVLSALNRMSFDSHKALEVGAGDTVIFSSRPIPGRERQIHGMMDRLAQLGAEIVDAKVLPLVHVSGHPASEDVRRLVSLVKPRWYVPFHGGYRFMRQGARIAEQVGIDTAMFVSGQWLRLTDDSWETEDEELTTFYVGWDEDDLMDQEAVKQRITLSVLGIAVVSLVLDKSGIPVERPSVKLMGFGTAGERSHLSDAISRRIEKELRTQSQPKRVTVDAFISSIVKSEVRQRFGTAPKTIVTVGGCLK